MVNFKTFDKCIIGGSHVKAGKVCQDHSGSYSDERMTIAIVADGHGSADYFRSDVGSHYAVEVAKAVLIQATNQILDKMTPAELARQITAYGKDNGQNPVADSIFDNIKNVIVASWRASVDQHFKANPFTEEDLVDVQKKYVDRLKNQGIYYWAYGTTLIASVVTENFWYAIQVGDGNCVAVYTEEHNGVAPLQSFVEDIPRDPFVGEGEATTSMCQANVIEGFRHYSSFEIPKLILVHSDGIDDSLLDEATRQGVYYNVGGSFAKGEAWAEENIEKAILTNIANNWKGDDTSMGVIYDTRELDALAQSLYEIATRKQSENNYKRAKAKAEELENACKALTATIAQEEAQVAEARRRFNEKGEEFKRASADIEECTRKIKELEARIESIKKQREQIKVQAEQIKARGIQVEALKKSNSEIYALKKKELDALKAKIEEYEKKNGIGKRENPLERLINGIFNPRGANPDSADKTGLDIPIIPVGTAPTEPATEPIAVPTEEPAIETVAEPVTEIPVTDNVTEITIEPTEQAQEVVEEPSTETEETPAEPECEKKPLAEPEGVVEEYTFECVRRESADSVIELTTETVVLRPTTTPTTPNSDKKQEASNREVQSNNTTLGGIKPEQDNGPKTFPKA